VAWGFAAFLNDQASYYLVFQALIGFSLLHPRALAALVITRGFRIALLEPGSPRDAQRDNDDSPHSV